MKGMFAGTRELMESHRRVGMIISNCAMLEGELAYLNWQLVAYAWTQDHPDVAGNDVQVALNAERAGRKWSKNLPLLERLRHVTKAIGARAVQHRAAQEPLIDETLQRYQRMCDRIRLLAQKRNDFCHSSLQMRAGKLEREFGILWGDTFQTSEAEEKDLMSEFGRLTTEIGQISTVLGFLLPFSDNNVRITATIC